MLSHVCNHGNINTCPDDRLCQVRLGGAQYGHWQTVAVFACDANVDSWRAQCGPVWRRRNYETRVIRLRDELSS